MAATRIFRVTYGPCDSSERLDSLALAWPRSGWAESLWPRATRRAAPRQLTARLPQHPSVGDAGGAQRLTHPAPQALIEVMDQIVALQATATCMSNAAIADMIAIVGSLDGVMGEVDR